MTSRFEFTGERYVPWLPGQIRYEHLHRYTSVVSACANMRVLDVACGEGYGSALLARYAADVIGIDIDGPSIEHATASYTAPNLHFLCASALSLPIPDGSVDIVVSFETLEHFAEHDEFAAEVRRVLRPGGVFFVSSPNKRVYSDIPQYTNDYHVRELYYDELLKLAQANFRNVRVYGQQLAAVSLMRAMEAGDGDTLLLQSPAPLPDAKPYPDPTYFIAACSDSDLPLSLSSVFIDDSDFLLDDISWAKADHRRSMPERTVAAVSVAEPIYVFGDSHTETFAMRCYDAGDRRFIFRPMYVPFAQASYFEAKPTKLSRHLLRALTAAGLLVTVTPQEIGVLHTTSDPHWRHVAIVRGIPHEDPAIVFAVGGVDLLRFSRETLSDFNTIVVDDGPVEPTSIAFADAVELFYHRMKPFEDALRTLQARGFSRLSVLSLVPFSSNDEQYARMASRLGFPQLNTHLASAWRATLFQIGNAALAKIADVVEVPFIDRGIDPDATGLADPGTLYDGIHLDAEARDRSAVEIINVVAQLPRKINPPRRPHSYQVTMDSEMSNFGISQMTISEESFGAIQEMATVGLCKLRDINTGTVIWVDRSRIVYIVPIG